MDSWLILVSYSGLLRLRNPAVRSSGRFWATVTSSTLMSAESSRDGILESLSLPTSSSPRSLFSSSSSDSGLSSRWSRGCVCDPGGVSSAVKVSMSLSSLRSHVGSKRNNHMMCNTTMIKNMRTSTKAFLVTSKCVNVTSLCMKIPKQVSLKCTY